MCKFPKIIILSLTLLFVSLSSAEDTFFCGNLSICQAQAYIQLNADQMKAALRCPTDESKAFIDDCFTLAARGILPESLILSAFQYANNQPKNQWAYFERTLELRCDHMNIDLRDEIAKLHRQK